MDTAGVRTTFGSLIHRDNVPRTDAVAIARLRGAGAILVGKTTTPEFGHKAFTDAPLFGQTLNAWDPERTCGGSSGAAAAAVARALAPLGVATDGGGSTRIPAACNGTVGFKQSAGAIAHSQTPDPFGNYTYVTPMTRTVADTAMMFEVMSGPHPSDPWSYVAPAPGKLAKPDSLRGIRIGVTSEFGSQALSRAMRDALDSAAAALESCGASVEPLNENIEPVEPFWRVINHANWRTRFLPLLARHRDQMTPTLVRQVEMAGNFSAVDFQQATFARGALFRRIQSWFGGVDALLMPTLSRTAQPLTANLFDPVDIDGAVYPEVRSAWFPYTMPFNLTGHPAISVPTGLGPDGLPLAVQLIGGYQADQDLLGLAGRLESELGWHGRIAP